jgi:hypothetical protein
MLVEADGNVGEKFTLLEYRKCIDEDWNKFYEPSKKNKPKIEKLKKKGSMHCLTGKDLSGKPVKFDIYGPDENSPHNRLEFLYKPCTPVNFDRKIPN